MFEDTMTTPHHNNPPQTIALGLHEELLLLMLRDERGTIEPGTMEQQALAGAIVAELMLLGRVDALDERKRTRATIIDPAPTGDDVLDECLGAIDASTRAHTLEYWISRLARRRDLKDKIADHLVAVGILRREKDRVLFVFPRTRYPETDHAPEGEIIDRLWKAVFAGGDVEDARTAVLVSLTNAADILPILFSRRDLKRRKARIEAIANGELVGPAVRHAIQAAQAAIIAACSAGAIAATS